MGKMKLIWDFAFFALSCAGAYYIGFEHGRSKVTKEWHDWVERILFGAKNGKK